MKLDLPIDNALLSDLVSNVDEPTAAAILEQIEAAIEGHSRADVLFALAFGIRRVSESAQATPDAPPLRSVCGLAAAIVLGKDCVTDKVDA